MLKTLGEIICAIREKETDASGKKKNQKAFGIDLGLSPDSAQSNISQYERNLTQPNFETLTVLLSRIGIDLLGLINEKLSGCSDDPVDPQLIEDLRLASDVLTSPYSAASALRSNIHTFHEAIEDKKQIIKEIQEIKKLREKLSAEPPSPFGQRPESGPDTTDSGRGLKPLGKIILKNQKMS